jgi:hypothetical protein
MSKKSRELKQRRVDISSASDELRCIHDDLSLVYRHFNNTNDPALLDAYIYEMSALKSRYDHALKNIKLLF